MLDEIVTKDGKGLMLHRADSFYNSGRSDDLLNSNRGRMHKQQLYKFYLEKANSAE